MYDRKNETTAEFKQALIRVYIKDNGELKYRVEMSWRYGVGG